ncbi:MAG: acetyl-CoA carboxylase carboxyl transferase subunit beta [Actinomycetota bacterium]|nr:acetyl-CoA carboxylase carboxyl transferase subunit beta [Actinomycetota bacterium]
MTEPHERLLDEGSFVERDGDLASTDPLGYPDYPNALRRTQAQTGAGESVIAGSGTIGGHEVEVAFFDFRFFGGSMGEVAGERLARGLERAASARRPFILRTATGGARMQEGMRSLVQMAKVVSARLALADSGAPLVVILGHPTTGGVLASLCALADVTFAAEGATVGFAGPRVAEAFTGRPLAPSSHTAASALANGLVDAVVDDERAAVVRALEVLAPDDPLHLEPPAAASGSAGVDEWEVVQTARAEDRFNPAVGLAKTLEVHIELQGDRSGTNDPAVVAAIGRIAGRRAVVIALDRRRSPAAAGFRKARRAVEIASRLRLPVVTFVDTRGADPSGESEAAGVAWEIARLFESLLSAPVPVVSIVTGEGGSGGALAFATGDVLVIYEDSFFSVIGPEGAAQILWRDSERAPEAARLLKVSAHDLHRLRIADQVVAGSPDAESLRRVVAYHLDRVTSGGLSQEALADERRRRWRSR